MSPIIIINIDIPTHPQHRMGSAIRRGLQCDYK